MLLYNQIVSVGLTGLMHLSADFVAEVGDGMMETTVLVF
jgi:hypothetical protein